MSLMEQIMGQLGGGGLQEISKKLGTDEKTTGNATSAAVTTLLGALARNSADPKGAEALEGALKRDHDGSALGDVRGLLQHPDLAGGEGILKHVLGGKRQKVERSLGGATGLQQGQMGDLMKMIAPVVMGALGKEKRKQGLDASSLARQLGQEREQLERQSPAGNVMSGLLDTDGDGDVDAQDLIKHGSGLLGKFLGR